MGRETNKQRRTAQAQTAREKAAAARSQQRREDQRRRAIVVLSVVVVLAVVGVVIGVFALQGNSGKSSVIANNRATAPTTVMQHVANVPTSTLDTVGVGSAISAPQPITGGASMTSAGKPELLYIGAEFCPYCAAERWAMGVALSRFGTLHGVKLTQSASNDVDPNTHTLDFVDASYTSKYLAFTPVENEDRNHNVLHKTTSQQNALWSRYELNGQRSYPFLDFANHYVVTGPTFDPKVLANLTQSQIAAKLADPNDPVAKGVDGAANVLSAAICGMTNDQPANICTSPAISKIRQQIDSQKPTSGSSG